MSFLAPMSKIILKAIMLSLMQYGIFTINWCYHEVSHTNTVTELKLCLSPRPLSILESSLDKNFSFNCINFVVGAL